GAGEVADLDDAQLRVEDFPVNEEINRNRRVVLGDAGLRGDLQEHLAQVHPDGFIHEGDEEDDPGPPRAIAAPEPEHDQALVFADDLDPVPQQEHADNDGGKHESRKRHAVPPRRCARRSIRTWSRQSEAGARLPSPPREWLPLSPADTRERRRTTGGSGGPRRRTCARHGVSGPADATRLAAAPAGDG